MSAMLSEAEKKMIEAEEQFRHEIKTKIMAEAKSLGAGISAVEKSFGSKMMDFFNSSLGAWFLSTVIVTGGAGLYQNIQHHYENQKAQHDQSLKYRYEIENRLDHLELGIRHAKTVGDARKALQRLYAGKYPLTPELQNRALGSMYLNLYGLLKGDDKERAKQAIGLIRQLEDASILLDSQPDTQTLNDADQTKLRQLIDAIKELHFNQLNS